MDRPYLYSIFLLILCPLLSLSKVSSPKASLQFLESHIYIGKATPICMTITHDADMVVIFPDSSKDFKPFEFVRSDVSSTHTSEGVSVDSVKYYIRSFSVRSRQSIRLPFHYVRGQDTLTTWVTSDTIVFQSQVSDKTDNLSFKSYNETIPLQVPPNYVWWGVGVLLAGGLLYAVVRALRKPLHTYMKRRRIRKEWLGVKRKLHKLRKAQLTPAALIESLNHVWKDYLSFDWKQSLRSMTTTEIMPVIRQREELSIKEKDTLIENTQVGDKIVYAGEGVEKTYLLELISQTSTILEKAYRSRIS